MAYTYEVGDIVKLKKKHPCGSFEWEILRVGADFRLKCTGCGKLIHLDEALSDELMEKVRKARDFSVDEEETVLFGSCSACRAGDKSKKTEGK